MKYAGLLLFCMCAVVAAKPNLEALLKELLKELDEDDVEQRGIGAIDFGGTVVGENFIQVKAIRHMDEVEADTKSKKPLYSVIYGKGQYDPTLNEHAATAKEWSELEMCMNGAEGCFLIKGLTPNTMYWVQYEVQMWVNGRYEYIKKKKDVKQIKTKGRGENTP